MQNILYMPAPLRDAFKRFEGEIAGLLEQAGTASSDSEILLVRLERYFADFYEPLARLYAGQTGFEFQLNQIARAMVAAYVDREPELKRLDLERSITPDWFQRETTVGGIYYVDLFAGNLQGVRERLDYLREMGLNYIHLMPLLKPRPGQNDGGYAVADYCEVNPALGSMSDLKELAAELRRHGISLCIDLVVNHTAKEHHWATRAMAGEAEYMDYYFVFDDRTLPDQYERTLPEIFPDFKPGNFTFYPQMAGSGKWVWTTFNEFQWDLNYTNPAVFRGMLDYMFYLGNQGIDVLRLDAVPFMWKRMGTNCQNQPEVHDLLQAFRSIVRVVAPSVIFKAEAIVPPQHLVHYLGTGRHAGKECDLAYNNSLMVQVWNALATRQVGMMTHTLQKMPVAPPGSTWVTYVRLHDDIGWAITDENAAAVGQDAFWHRKFLYEFYAGKFPGSFSRGDIFQFNPRTLEGRTSGMTASLAGLELALATRDEAGLDLSIRRILLLYSIIFSYGGIPLIYMGDELGLLNYYDYTHDPLKAQDNRWMHRPPMDWAKAARRHDPSNPAGRIYAGMRYLIETRRQTRQLHSAGLVEPIWSDNQHVFAYQRKHPAGNFLGLCNFSEHPQPLNADIIWHNQLGRNIQDAFAPGKAIQTSFNLLTLAPYQFMWLTGENEPQIQS